MQQILRSALVLIFVAPPGHTRTSWSDELPQAVTFYASFDKKVIGDSGGGELGVSTRSDDPERKGSYFIREGFPKEAFRIVDDGKHGGCLEAVKVLPRRGRLFFPAKGNIGFQPGGWNGSASFWLKTNPDTMLETRFCDPIQITQKRAHDGALWIDFPDSKPRDLRLGAFTALDDGEKPLKESAPLAPLIRVKKIGFKESEWHHLVMTWRNLDSGKADATVALWIDGKRVGELKKRNIAMKWDVKKTGIYFAVGLIGQMDELAIFRRALTPAEIVALHNDAGLVSRLVR